MTFRGRRGEKQGYNTREGKEGKPLREKKKNGERLKVSSQERLLWTGGGGKATLED